MYLTGFCADLAGNRHSREPKSFLEVFENKFQNMGITPVPVQTQKTSQLRIQFSKGFDLPNLSRYLSRFYPMYAIAREIFISDYSQ